ncbi:DUF551 domain-containing protein [Escherichia coli]|uniref:DUF551 domain-containing protein n=1 Tax=Escherichia coli TaxID=562 RepID=UPI0030F47407
MTTFTKEQLIEIIKRNITVMDRYPDLVTAQMDLEVYKIALASLEAEPVAWECGENIILFNPDTVEAYAKRAEISPKPLYAAPPVPVIQADVAQAIENLKQKLVECNRYNYCADAVKGVEDACRAVSYSQADNQPASGNQAAESNRDNEWTGNPDIDNAIIMLDRIDTLENCDDDRIEAVKAVLRRLAGNYPVTPDSWISCSERMPAQDDWILIYSKHGEYMAGQVQGEYVELSDGTLSWLGNALYWMPLPEPPKEAK